MFKADWDMQLRASDSPEASGASNAAASNTTQTHPLRLRGRYMLADRSEHECETITVGVDGIEFLVRHCGAVGERVIAYIDELGRIEGCITGLAPSGFLLAPRFTPAKRERMFKKIEWLHERQQGRASDGRRHERIEPDTHAWVEIMALDGRREAKVIDYSRGGVALETDAALEIGDPVQIGSVKARVVRSGPGYLAARFEELLPDSVAPLSDEAA
jgi:hypothetical protein